MLKIVPIKPSNDVVEGLKNIIDGIENGSIAKDNCTVITGGEIFHLGTANDSQAASDAVFNMTYGIHRLMSACVLSDGD
jgi:hypothetical protein